MWSLTCITQVTTAIRSYPGQQDPSDPFILATVMRHTHVELLSVIPYILDLPRGKMSVSRVFNDGAPFMFTAGAIILTATLRFLYRLYCARSTVLKLKKQGLVSSLYSLARA